MMAKICLPKDPSQNPLVAVALERLWEEAYFQWLQDTGTPTTKHNYHRSWKLLLAFSEKRYWELTPRDIEEWSAYLFYQGYKPGTVNCHLIAISSFFTYASETYKIPDGKGRVIPLHSHNPVEKVQRPKPEPYCAARYLSNDQVRDLLGAIPQHTVQGKRDFALILTLLMTGRHNSEVRMMRLGDFERKIPGLPYVWYHWKDHGKDRCDALSKYVVEKIEAYLEAAGRLGEMDPQEYIFTPVKTGCMNLPKIRSAGKWNSEMPLSVNQVNRLVKKYAAMAGLDARAVTVQCLRHTAAMIRKDAGDVTANLARFLGFDWWETEKYLSQLSGKMDVEYVEDGDSGLSLPLYMERQPRQTRWIWGRSRRYRQPTKRELCKEWLLRLLEEHKEGMVPKEIERLGKRVGYSETTIRRARKELEGTIVTEKAEGYRWGRWVLGYVVLHDESADSCHSCHS